MNGMGKNSWNPLNWFNKDEKNSNIGDMSGMLNGVVSMTRNAMDVTNGRSSANMGEFKMIEGGRGVEVGNSQGDNAASALTSMIEGAEKRAQSLVNPQGLGWKSENMNFGIGEVKKSILFSVESLGLEMPEEMQSRINSPGIHSMPNSNNGLPKMNFVEDKERFRGTYGYIMNGNYDEGTLEEHQKMVAFINKEMSKGNFQITDEFVKKYYSFVESTVGLSGTAAKPKDLRFDKRGVGIESRRMTVPPNYGSKTRAELDKIVYWGQNAFRVKEEKELHAHEIENQRRERAENKRLERESQRKEAVVRLDELSHSQQHKKWEQMKETVGIDYWSPEDYADFGVLSERFGRYPKTENQRYGNESLNKKELLLDELQETLKDYGASHVNPEKEIELSEFLLAHEDKERVFNSHIYSNLKKSSFAGVAELATKQYKTKGMISPEVSRALRENLKDNPKRIKGQRDGEIAVDVILTLPSSQSDSNGVDYDEVQKFWSVLENNQDNPYFENEFYRTLMRKNPWMAAAGAGKNFALTTLKAVFGSGSGGLLGGAYGFADGISNFSDDVEGAVDLKAVWFLRSALLKDMTERPEFYGGEFSDEERERWVSHYSRSLYADQISTSALKVSNSKGINKVFPSSESENQINFLKKSGEKIIEGAVDNLVPVKKRKALLMTPENLKNYIETRISLKKSQDEAMEKAEPDF